MSKCYNLIKIAIVINCEDYKPDNAIVKSDLQGYFSETDNAIIKIEEVKSK